MLMGYLRLARPANLPTAMADILAGLAISGWVGNFFLDASLQSVAVLPAIYLLLASTFLYAGGVVLNDVFDARLDQVERPERPIPSGLVSRRSAMVYGLLLLIAGILAATQAHALSALIAALLSVSILTYDAISKKYSFLGPLNMGICRGLNLLLGMSVVGSLTHWWLAVIPVLYIFAITLLSRGEVHGNNKKQIIWAAFLYTLVIFIVLYISFAYPMNISAAIIFLVLFAYLIFTPLVRAFRENSAINIKKAVMAGVISIIVLDASMAVAFTNWQYGLAILLLWPLSRLLAKIFAVT